MKKNNNLTQGSALKVLVTFALPFLFANFMQAFYGAADLFVVGQFSGTSSISAVNIGSQIMQIITSFVIGISMGTTVTLGQNIGSKKFDEAAKTVGNTIIIFVFFAILITPIMIWQSGTLADLMQTPVEALQETKQYVIICSSGLPFIVAYNVISAVLRGMGDSKTPMYFVGIACIVNVLGDLLLTGIFGMGVIGAAIATTSAQCVSSICGIIYLVKKGLGFPFSKYSLKCYKGVLKRILFIGIPIAMQDTLINISFMLLTVIANERGVVASSAVGVVEKLILFMFLVPSSMLSSISAITAQNIGAGKKERAILSLKYGIIITVAFGIIMCTFSQIFPNLMTRIFAKDMNVVIEASEYLRTYSIDCILVGVTFCINGYLCGIGKSIITFFHNTISIFLVRIPTAFILSRMFKDSLLPMGLASPIGSIASIIILCIYWLWQKKHIKTDV